MILAFNNICLVFMSFIIGLQPGLQDEVLIQGNNFFNSQNYYNAVTEYKRYIFFNSEPENVSLPYAYYKMGMAYRNELELDKAVNALNKSISLTGNLKFAENRKIDIAVIHISNQNYSLAKLILLKLEMYSQSTQIKKRAFFLHAVCNLYEYNWSEAKQMLEEFYHIDSKGKLNKKEEKVISLLKKAVKTKYKSPSLAKWLSTFIPGAGQIYCGDWKNGINALAINSLTGYIFVDDIINKNIEDIIVYSFFLFNRYYQGNRTLAQEAANKYNEKMNSRIAAEIMSILSKD